MIINEKEELNISIVKLLYNILIMMFLFFHLLKNPNIPIFILFHDIMYTDLFLL